MRVEVITHPSGDQLPILLDKDGLPIPTPNEFILGRRALGTNTLVRNLRELTVFYRWLDSAFMSSPPAPLNGKKSVKAKRL